MAGRDADPHALGHGATVGIAKPRAGDAGPQAPRGRHDHQTDGRGPRLFQEATVKRLCMLAVDQAIEAQSPRAADGAEAADVGASAAPPPAPPSTAGWDRCSDERMKWLHAKLSFEDAERMRAMRHEGATWKELQATFGVSKATVRAILAGERLCGAAGDGRRGASLEGLARDRAAGRGGSLEPIATAPWEEVPTRLADVMWPLDWCEPLDGAEIVRLHEEGLSAAAIGERLGVGAAQIVVRLLALEAQLREDGPDD